MSEAMSTRQQNNGMIQAVATPGNSQFIVAFSGFQACYKILTTDSLCIKVNLVFEEQEKYHLKLKLQKKYGLPVHAEPL